MKRWIGWLSVLLLIGIGATGCVRDAGEDSAFEYTITDGEAELTAYTGTQEQVEIPDSYEGHKVTSIGARAFYNCTNLKTVTIPDSVIRIGEEAFALCSSLVAFQVGEGSLTYAAVDGVLFSKDQNTLVSFPEGKEGDYTVPTGVKTLGQQAFSRCHGLTAVTLPASVTTIKAAAFYDCTALTALTIPDGVTTIGPTAFCRSTALKEVTLPAGLTVLETGLFSDCQALERINIPAGVTEIKEAVFWNCTSLTAFETAAGNTVFDAVDGVLLSKDHTRLIRYPAGKTGDTYTLPDSVKELAEEAFSYNIHLTSVRLPGRLNTVSNTVFYQCTALEQVVLDEGIVSIGEKAFGSCTALMNLTLPSTLTTIGESAFNNNSALTTVTFPKGLQTIGEGAFSYCSSLTNIMIPAGVTTIGVTAFGGNENMRLYGEEGSEAERYAATEDIPFNDNDIDVTTTTTAA